MRDKLLGLLDKFAKTRIAVIGDLVADEFVYGETDRISREAPVLIVRYESSELKPGCAANAAMNLCTLGAKVSVLGVVGSDEIGARLKAALSDAGADVSRVETVDGKPTATKTRVLAGGKNTRRQQMIRIDKPGPGAPSAAVTQRLLGSLDALKCDALMISDYGGGLMTPPVIDSCLAQKRLVCVDARYGLTRYAGATVVKPNEVELQDAVGRSIGDDPHALEEAGRELLRRMACESLLVTRGRSGMALMRPGEKTVFVAVHGSADAVDVTGAGDTVMAVNTLARAAGADPVDAMRLANVAGALVVQKQGTATVSVAEIREELRK